MRLDALERPEALPYAQAQEAQHSSADLVIDGAEIFQEALEHVQPVSEVLDAHHLAHLVRVRLRLRLRLSVRVRVKVGVRVRLGG